LALKLGFYEIPKVRKTSLFVSAPPNQAALAYVCTPRLPRHLAELLRLRFRSGAVQRLLFFAGGIASLGCAARIRAAISGEWGCTPLTEVALNARYSPAIT